MGLRKKISDAAERVVLGKTREHLMDDVRAVKDKQERKDQGDDPKGGK